MNENVNSERGFLKEKMAGFRVQPSGEAWRIVSASLDGKNRRGLYIVVISAAASLALAVTLGINYFGSGIQKDGGATAGQEHATEQDVPARADRSPEQETAGAVEHEPYVGNESLTQVESSGGDEPAIGMDSAIGIASASAGEAGEQKENDVIGPQEQAAGESGKITQKQGNELQQAVSLHIPKEKLPELLAKAPRGALRLDGREPLNLVQGENEKTGDLAEPLFEEKEFNDSRWALGASLSPLYSFRDAQSSALGGAREYESGMIAYAGGVQVSYRTNRRLAFESGILFNKTGIAIGEDGIRLSDRAPDFDFAGPQGSGMNVTALANSVGNIVSNSGDVYVNNYKLGAEGTLNSLNDINSQWLNSEEGINQHLDYLEVPFNLRYTLLDRDIELQLVGGVSTNLLVSNSVTMETPDGPVDIGYLTNIRTVNYSGNAGIGMVYHLKKQFSFTVEPRFRYFLNSINDSTLPSTRPYTFGLYTGLNYTF